MSPHIIIPDRHHSVCYLLRHLQLPLFDQLGGEVVDEIGDFLVPRIMRAQPEQPGNGKCWRAELPLGGKPGHVITC